MSSPDRHLDLDALADILAGEAPHGADEHVDGCAQCRADLDDLRAAQARVTYDLSGLPELTIPADVADRLHESLPVEGGLDSVLAGDSASVTTLPPASSRGSLRWLPVAAAALVLLAGAGYGISRLGSSPSESGGGSTAAKAAPELTVKRNSTGIDYSDRASLAAAVPGLLAGHAGSDSALAQQAPAPTASGPQRAAGINPQADADPLARLRGNAGLADCLVALLPPDDPSVQPLALDYASFHGKPAMVVLLPGTLEGKLDVFVVGPGCSQANDSVLFYTSVDKP